MGEKRKNAISVYFNEEENTLIQKALKNSVLTETTLIRYLARELIINKYKYAEEITLTFPLKGRIDKTKFKIKVVKFSEEDYTTLTELSEKTHMIPSNLIMHMIRPELEKLSKK